METLPETPARALRTRALPALAGVLTAFFLLETAAVLWRTGGSFTYTLDDPYIHLALSEQIRSLHYGLDPGEVSTPSSSVAWPFLLAIPAGTPLHAGTPLLLGYLATLASGWLLLRLGGILAPGAAERRPVVTALLAAAPVLALNWAGVVFTGMEHAAHVTATLAVGVGLVEVAVRRAVPWELVAGLVAGPLLRYEGLAVTAAAAVVLFRWGFRRTALLAPLAAVLPLAAFSAVALANGLDPLPSSVLMKSDVAGGDGPPLAAVEAGLREASGHLLFVVLAGFLLVDALAGAGRRARRRPTALHGYALAVLAAHAVLGRFGWFSRYELYAYAAVLPVVAFLVAGRLRRPARLGQRSWLVAAAALAVLGCLPYVSATLRVPAAAENIHLQQAQMARFAAEHWRGPVAVNDIGLVGYESADPVLDLWGLASEQAREARAAGDDPAWMARLAGERGVGLAMIYDEESWFPALPPSWEPVAVLVLDQPRVTVGGREVTFLATSPDAVARLRDELRRFARTLPDGAHLEFRAAAG